MNHIPIFKSQLAGLLEKYIEYRRMRGYKSNGGEEYIKQFDVFVTTFPIETGDLIKELVEAFIASRPGEKPQTQSHRISAVRGFGRYLVRCGIDAYVLPSGILPVAKYKFIPHVFNTADVVRLISAAESLPHRANSPNRHIVIPMMFRIIYGCGLRISEAINLLIEDVDLQAGVLLIRATKFNKYRYVPMAQPLLLRCRDYVKQISLPGNPKAPLFPSPTGSCYRKTTIGHAFRQCLFIAGMPHYDDGPTIHSLRHSFAVHNLVRWGKENKDINALLPYLSAYMGHENLLGTERYLRMTKEMFPEIREQINAVCSWMIPEVIRHEG